jgi:hypothetical protein
MSSSCPRIEPSKKRKRAGQLIGKVLVANPGTIANCWTTLVELGVQRFHSIPSHLQSLREKDEIEQDKNYVMRWPVTRAPSLPILI